MEVTDEDFIAALLDMLLNGKNLTSVELDYIFGKMEGRHICDIQMAAFYVGFVANRHMLSNARIKTLEDFNDKHLGCRHHLEKN